MYSVNKKCKAIEINKAQDYAAASKHYLRQTDAPKESHSHPI